MSRWPVTRREPEIRGEGAIAGILGEPRGQVDVSLLENIRRVDPALEPAIEPKPHHLAQGCMMPLPEFGERGCFAGGRTLQERFVVA